VRSSSEDAGAEAGAGAGAEAGDGGGAEAGAGAGAEAGAGAGAGAGKDERSVDVAVVAPCVLALFVEKNDGCARRARRARDSRQVESLKSDDIFI
jgi:hypothetical protein